MTRIAGINIPDNQHTVIGLTKIFGIGINRSKDILSEARIAENIKKGQIFILSATAPDTIEHVAQTNKV